MAAPTKTYVDPSTSGNDFGGTSFTDGVSSSSGTVITKTGAFPAATTRVNDKIFLDDNGSGDVTTALYTITVRTDDNTITIGSDCRSGAPEATDVKCTLHDGTVSLPWNTVQHALKYTTQDTTNGDLINIKAGATDTLIATWAIATDYGSPTFTTPLTFRGYTSTSGDGGIGVISGGGSVAIVSEGALDSVIFADLRLTNTDSNTIITLDIKCAFINCEIDTCSGSGVFVDDNAQFINCYFHDITGNYAIEANTSSSCIVYGCIIISGVTNAGITVGSGSSVINNIIKLTTTNGAEGIVFSDNTLIANNSIFATAGTGNGIGGLAGRDGVSVLNNIAEGFVGVGGAGYSGSSTDHWTAWGHNAAFNNTEGDERSGSGTETMVDLGGDDIPLAASPFTAPGSNDFSVGTEVKATAMPNFTGGATTPGTTQFLDMGAAQREEAGGGGTTGDGTGMSLGMTRV